MSSEQYTKLIDVLLALVEHQRETNEHLKTIGATLDEILNVTEDGVYYPEESKDNGRRDADRTDD